MCANVCEFHVFFFLKGWAVAMVLGVEEDLINFCVVMFHREYWCFIFSFSLSAGLVGL